MGADILVEPQGEVGIAAVDLVAEAGLERWRREVGRDAIELGARHVGVVGQDLLPLGLDLAGEFLGAEVMDEDLDALLVDVVAARPAIPHAQRRLAIAEQVVDRQERADQRGDERGAAHAAADIDLEAELAGVVLHQFEADIVQADRGAILVRRGQRDLELAWQVVELGMQVRPLANDLAVRPGIIHLVRGDSRHVIGGNKTKTKTTKQDGMHLDRGQLGENIGNAFELRPVELQVRARSEVPIAAVVLLRNIAELAQLARAEQAVGDRDAQHGRMALDIEAVAQADGLELIFRQLARQEAARLVPEFGYALVYESLVELIVLVHALDYGGVPRSAPKTLWLCIRRYRL